MELSTIHPHPYEWGLHTHIQINNRPKIMARGNND